MKTHLAEIVADLVGPNIEIQLIMPLSVMNALPGETLSGIATCLEPAKDARIDIRDDHLVITVLSVDAKELRSCFPTLFHGMDRDVS